MTPLKTSSWSTKLPAGHVRIGISRGTPRGMKGYRRYPKLHPGPWFKSGLTPKEFKRLYFKEILRPLDPETVVAELHAMAPGSIPVLLCWESPPPDERWCHRSLVSVWLWEELGLIVPEFGHEALGYGWQHPKLHPVLMRAN